MSLARRMQRAKNKRLRAAVKIDTRRIARGLLEADPKIDPRRARGQAAAHLEQAHAWAFLVFQMGQLR